MINRLLEFTLQRLREKRNIYINTIIRPSLNFEEYRSLASKIQVIDEIEEILKSTYDSLVNHKDINK